MVSVPDVAAPLIPTGTVAFQLKDTPEVLLVNCTGIVFSLEQIT
jgi:hypothetical protein